LICTLPGDWHWDCVPPKPVHDCCVIGPSADDELAPGAWPDAGAAAAVGATTMAAAVPSAKSDAIERVLNPMGSCSFDGLICQQLSAERLPMATAAVEPAAVESATTAAATAEQERLTAVRIEARWRRRVIDLNIAG
jgi:hypothetical protein